MDYQKILPSKEAIRRFFERATALYEIPQPGNNHAPRRRRHTPKRAKPRDISEYLVNEAAPTNAYLEGVIQKLLVFGGGSPDTLAAMQRRFDLWKSWLKFGMTAIVEFATSVQNFLPCMFSCFMKGSPHPPKARPLLARLYFSSQTKHKTPSPQRIHVPRTRHPVRHLDYHTSLPMFI